MSDDLAGASPVDRGVMAPAPKREYAALRVVPCDLKTANDFVRRLHRHSRPVVGHKFAVAVAARHPIGDAQPGGAGVRRALRCSGSSDLADFERCA